jgi:hypothetical protein
MLTYPEQQVGRRPAPARLLRRRAQVEAVARTARWQVIANVSRCTLTLVADRPSAILWQPRAAAYSTSLSHMGGLYTRGFV